MEKNNFEADQFHYLKLTEEDRTSFIEENNMPSHADWLDINGYLNNDLDRQNEALSMGMNQNSSWDDIMHEVDAQRMMRGPTL